MKDAEEIIISKRFFELTPGELEAVKEFAANEEDYEAMRWFLQQTKSSFAEEKIEASANLRAGVMAHLNQKPSGKTIWLNGVGAFLFPAQKKFYQYPAFQIAAVGLLLVGFVFMYDGTLTDGDKTMAVNDKNNDEQIISENKVVTEKEGLSDEVAVVIESEETKESDTRNQNAQNGPGVGMNVAPITERAEETAVVTGSSNLLAMSVAEESRVVSDEKLLEQQPYGVTNTVSPDQNFYRVDATSATGGTTVETKNVTTTDDLAISGELKKESEVGYKDKSNADEDGKKNEKTTVAPADVSGNYGTVSTTTVAINNEKSDMDGEAYLTGSAGGVFGDTASEPEKGLDSTLDADVPAKDFSLSQTKELRSLFFVVK